MKNGSNNSFNFKKGKSAVLNSINFGVEHERKTQKEKRF